MHNMINAFPLYNFLQYCNSSFLEKNILDCGAGGSNPPLSLFSEFDYKTYGIEICEDQLIKAIKFCETNDMNLNIVKGDMKAIPFDNGFFSYLYSYNTSVHMKKTDFSIAISEFARVLKEDGICYVNFLSKECSTYGMGIEKEQGEFTLMEDNEEVHYCHYADDEPERYFKEFNIIYKEKRIIEREIDGCKYISGYLDYILRKK